MLLALVLVFGLAIGSFLNVVIARLPASESLVRPRSRCPSCGARIAWHDNIPLVSYLALRGRCRTCSVAISWQYPIVEAATAALFALAWVRFGPSPDFAVAAVLVAALVVITAIDLSHQLIPDVITLPGILAGAVANVALDRLSLVNAALGVVVGGGLFLVIILVSGGGMGGGDMKLGAMLGAFLGWKLVLVAILFAVVAGGALAAVLLLTRAKGRKDPIPFGPFLATGGTIALLWGERLMTWYLRAFAG